MIRALKQGSHAFLFDPRLGKTKAALDTIAVQHHRGKVQRVVVIAPLIALDVWVGQIKEHFAVRATIKVVDESTIIRTPGRNRRGSVKFYLVNCDKFSRRGENETYRNRYLRQVERWDPDLVVLDESHRFKSAGAVRSQSLWRAIHRLRKSRGIEDGRPFVYLLTGTPNPKGYRDLFAQYRILDDRIFGTSKSGFEEDYCVFGFGRRKYTIIRYRHKKELLDKIRARATICTTDEAGLAGKQFFNPIHIKLPAEVRHAYSKLAKEFLVEIQGKILDAPNAGVRRMRLLQLTGGFTTDGEKIHNAKLASAKDFLRDLREQGESVVVYARFLPEVRALHEVCETVGYSSESITGGVPRKRRTEAISIFQRGEGKTPHALVFQADAGSLAIELTAAAEVVFYSLPDSWDTFYQCLERVRGPKQNRPVRYTFLIARGTVDMSVLAALRNKRDMHAELMRSPKSFLLGL